MNNSFIEDKKTAFGEDLRMLRNYKNICQEGMAARLNFS